MKLAYKDIPDSAEMDMSPMIDMVFLLLIFFLVASQVVDSKPFIEIPEAESAVIPNDIKNRLMITVKKDGSYYLGNDELPAQLDAVKNRIAAELNDNENLSILIRADANVRYEANRQIVESCADLGANSMIYATYQP